MSHASPESAWLPHVSSSGATKISKTKIASIVVNISTDCGFSLSFVALSQVADYQAVGRGHLLLRWRWLAKSHQGAEY